MEPATHSRSGSGSVNKERSWHAVNDWMNEILPRWVTAHGVFIVAGV